MVFRDVGRMIVYEGYIIGYKDKNFFFIFLKIRNVGVKVFLRLFWVVL